jgi:NitT/TauT family transport system ATP-binding protein
VLFVSSEIDEAIFLADTLLVMSHRPGRIIRRIPIDLPRPRLPSVLTSLEYLHYKAEALELLHAEAMKAFAAGSKAAADFVDAYAARDEPDSS